MFSSFPSTTSTGDADQSTSAKPIDVISPERKDAFCEFVLSLPRKCSPTICGILQPPPPPLPMNETLRLETESFSRGDAHDDEEGYVPMETSSFQGVGADDSLTEDERELISGGNGSSTAAQNNNSSSALKDSIWSIDEWSELYGGDFDNVHELEHFHEYESEQLSQRLDNESRLFFSQASINPSPVADRTGGKEEDKENRTNCRRSTASFIRYIDTLDGITGKASQVGHQIKTSATAPTPTNLYDQSTIDHAELDDQDQDQLDSGNFTETATTANKRTPCKQRNVQQYHHQLHSKISFMESISDFDSNVFSGTNTTTTMDISFEQSASNLSSSAMAAISSSGGGLILNHRCGGLSKFESHSLQIKYNEYFDFSPISPISRRTPQRNAVGGNGAGRAGDGVKNNAATRTTPSFNDGNGGGQNTVFKTPSSKQRVLQRIKLFNDQAFESTPTTDRLNF